MGGCACCAAAQLAAQSLPECVQWTAGVQAGLTLLRLMPLSSTLRVAALLPTALTDSRQLQLSQAFWLLLGTLLSYCLTVPSSAADQNRYGLLGSTSTP